MKHEDAQVLPADEGRLEPTVRPAFEARWYCVSRDGLATLCLNEANARDMVAECVRDYPRQAPYRAVRLVDAEELEREHADHKETLRDVDSLVAAERERCARVAEQQAERNGLAAGWHIAAEIRGV